MACLRDGDGGLLLVHLLLFVVDCWSLPLPAERRLAAPAGGLRSRSLQVATAHAAAATFAATTWFFAFKYNELRWV